MSTQDEYSESIDSLVELLDFMHFARYMQFSKTDPREEGQVKLPSKKRFR